MGPPRPPSDNATKGLTLDVASEPTRESIERSQTIHRPQHQPTIFRIEPEPRERAKAKRNDDLLENTKVRNLAILSDSMAGKSTILSEQPSRRNILIVGDVGVGKSALVNLIAGEDRAVTSAGAKACTLQSQEHLVTLDAVEFALYDTAGLREPQGNMKASDYLEAVFQGCTLISRLEQWGGIKLLVLCLKGGRISITMQQTYNLFAEVLCNRQVPIVIVVTHLEMFDDMEQWWRENEIDIKEYGLRSIGHACITTARGYRGIFSDKYEKSRVIVRKLLLDFSGEGVWKEEKASWVKRHMRSWLPPLRQDQFDVSDIRRKLVKRCGFSIEDAELTAQKIEQSRRASEDAPGEERSWFNKEFANSSRIVVNSGTPQEPSNVKATPSVIPSEGKDVVKKSVAEEPSSVEAAYSILPRKEAAREIVADVALPRQPRRVKASPGVIPDGDEGVTKKNVADGALLRQPRRVKASPGVIPDGDEGVTKNTANSALLRQPRKIMASPGAVPDGKGMTKKNMAEDVPVQPPSNVKSAPGVVPHRRVDASKKSVAPGGVAVRQAKNSKAVPATRKEGHKPGESREKANDRHSVAKRAKFERRNTR